jgi:uncharacterized protein
MISSLPVEQKQRIVLVDIIRGFALIGVLFANFNGYVEQMLPGDILSSLSTPADKFIMSLNSIFIEWKFMTLFSVLFGYGFGLILQSLDKKGINPAGFFIRRMSWLFIFGIVHCLFWWGDVLNLYAMSGVLLLFLRKLSNKNIFILSLVFMFIVPVVFSYLTQNLPETYTDADLRYSYEIYKSGNLAELFMMNMAAYYKMYVASYSNLGDIIETLGRFLMGYFLLRINVLDSIDLKSKQIKKIMLITFPVMIAYFVFRWLRLSDIIHYSPLFLSPLIKVGIFSTTTFYVSLLVLAYINNSQNKFFTFFQSLGTMTLTNYLMVSAILVIILYGIGFGYIGKIPVHIIWLLAFFWLVFEIIFSRIWLNKFRYGPMEWIWRQLTYGKRLPLRK